MKCKIKITTTKPPQGIHEFALRSKTLSDAKIEAKGIAELLVLWIECKIEIMEICDKGGK